MEQGRNEHMSTNTTYDRTVGELAAGVPVSIRIFEQWKIDYCCGGMTPLADACATAGRSVDVWRAKARVTTLAPGSAREREEPWKNTAAISSRRTTPGKAAMAST
jgi:regulator of cell morphogenesis and NO signaling